MTLQRIIEKNIVDLSTTQAGSSEIIDLFGVSGGVKGYSLQALYTVGTFSAAAIASATNIYDSSDPDHPSQFEKTNHGFVTGLKVQIATGGTLPDPLVALTDYFVIKIDDNFFQLAASLLDAEAGTEIALVDAGVGTQTITAVALAGASVTFQKSNDAVNWIDIQTATTISATGQVMYEKTDPTYRYIKAVKAITAGSVDLNVIMVGIGESI
jgi:hypothetical protein